jgi:hypothetical protein
VLDSQVLGLQSVEQNQKVDPAQAQLGEKPLLMREQQVLAAVSDIVLHDTDTNSVQSGQRFIGKQITIKPPLDAGGG